MTTGTSLLGCRHCGQVHTRVDPRANHRLLCTRCGAALPDPATAAGNAVSGAFALAALLIYPLAISLPIMRVEQLGHVNEASVYRGSITLLQKGEWLVGGVVFLCSVVLPLFKLIALLAATAGAGRIGRRDRVRLYRLVEVIGRWGMLDVLLVAVMVATLKLGDLVHITPGPGLLTFTVCVVLSLAASMTFDPHRIWAEDEP